MKKKIYFDSNVFDHIHKCIGISKKNIKSLLTAVKTGKISVLASILNIEEILFIHKQSPSQAKKEIKLILQMTDLKKKMIKPPDILLREDIYSYVQAKLRPNYFLNTRNNLDLNFLLNPEELELSEVIKATQVQKDQFKKRMNEARELVLPEAKKIKVNQPDFLEYLNRLSQKLAEGLVTHLGVLEECKARGLQGLLKIRSIRLFVGYSLSLIYAQSFEGQTPQPSDYRDLQHAVSASTSDIFVTDDKQFLRLLSRIPISYLQILTLPDFIKKVC